MKRSSSIAALLAAAILFAGTATDAAAATAKKSTKTSAKTSTSAKKKPATKTAAPKPAEAKKEAGPDRKRLLDPDSLNETAPETYSVRFDTTKGMFVIEVTRAWAPAGADRFYNLVKNGYYDDVRFFRVVSGFMAQFGIHGDPAVNTAWKGSRIPDDPVTQSNSRGAVTFAMAGPNTRTTQLFISYVDNSRLDGMGFAPFGKISEGMEVVDGLYAGYGEGAPRGSGPSQERMQSEGNTYLAENFANLDSIKTARIVKK